MTPQPRRAPRLYGRTYDCYGTSDPDLGGVSALVAACLAGPGQMPGPAVTFEQRHGGPIGAYYLATVAPGREIRVESNRITDEEGPYLRWPDYAAHATIVTAKLVLYTAQDPLTWLTGLRQQVAAVPALEFLRHIPPARPRRPPGPAPAARWADLAPDQRCVLLAAVEESRLSDVLAECAGGQDWPGRVPHVPRLAGIVAAFLDQGLVILTRDAAEPGRRPADIPPDQAQALVAAPAAWLPPAGARPVALAATADGLAVYRGAGPDGQ